MTLDPFTLSYIEAALWSSSDDDGDSLERFGVDDLAPWVRHLMIEDCRTFQETYGEWITEENYEGSKRWSADEVAGRDFWLTRNGHRAGFWDGDWSDEADAVLTEGSRTYGSFGLYVGDDNRVHGYPF